MHGAIDTEPALFFWGPDGTIAADIHETDEGAIFRILGNKDGPLSASCIDYAIKLDVDQLQALGWFCVSQFMVDEPNVLIEKLRAALKGSLSPTSPVFGMLDELEQGLRKP